MAAWEQTARGGQERFHKAYELEVRGADGAAVVLSFDQSGAHDVGLSVWDGGVVLAKSIEQRVHAGELDLRGKTIVDVGSGTGIVGLACAALGAHTVVLTDLPHTVLPLIKRNVARNEAATRAYATTIDVQPLDWTEPAHAHALASHLSRIDFLLFGEVTYYEHLIDPLLATLAILSAAHRPTVLMSHGTHRISPLLRFFRSVRLTHHVRVGSLARLDRPYRSAAHKLFLKQLEPLDARAGGHSERDAAAKLAQPEREPVLERLSFWMERKATLLEEYGRVQWRMLESAALLEGDFERVGTAAHAAGTSARAELERLPEQSATLLEQLGHAEWQCCECIAQLQTAPQNPLSAKASVVPKERAYAAEPILVAAGAAPDSLGAAKAVLSAMLQQRAANSDVSTRAKSDQ
mmetsp:Transcript_2638/g.7199  ORF Transcript_2638/g.7199 Transcript_2638/m.7199 type:complete len:407 (-) Transcript_2638:2161-3381(-)